MTNIANKIKKIAATTKEQAKYQKIMKITPDFWLKPDRFLVDLYNKTKTEFGGKFTGQQKLDLIQYLQDSGSLIKPKDAEIFFGLIHNTDKLDPNQDVTELQFVDFIIANEFPEKYNDIVQQKTN